jgi:hypothetical protein
MFKIFLQNLIYTLFVLFVSAGIGSFIGWLLIDVAGGGCVWIAGLFILVAIVGFVAWNTYNDLKGEN